MKTKLEKQPVWVDRALQGVTYWMGQRRCLYRDYPLSEGALVAEVCRPHALWEVHWAKYLIRPESGGQARPFYA